MLVRGACFWSAVFGLLIMLSLAAPAGAQSGQLSIELNQLENVERGCRGAVVFTNGLDTTVRELAVEVAVFDQDGRVKNLWLLPARSMSPGKITVRQFLFQEESCDDIGHILLNDVVNCEVDGELDREQCLAIIDVSSRTDVEFIATLARQD